MCKVCTNAPTLGVEVEALVEAVGRVGTKPVSILIAALVLHFDPESNVAAYDMYESFDI